MDITGRVRILDDSTFGVWRIEANPTDLKYLGDPVSRSRGRSVILLGDCNVTEDGNSLIFSIGKAKLLVLGDGEDSLVISTSDVDQRPTDKPVQGRAFHNVGVSSLTCGIRSGDEEFLDACRDEKLPVEIVTLGQNFLSRVRQFSKDVLREGQHRKWVTYPKNFLALTIQNRNQQFCVHVKKSTELDRLTDVLDIRDDRPGYVRFWLKDDIQLEAAVRAAKASYRV